MKQTFSIHTVEGVFTASFTDQGLVRLGFPDAGRRPSTASDLSGTPARVAKWLKLTEAALAATLAGKTPAALPPLDWSQASEFQKRVWSALRRIAPGQTASYSDVAKSIGRPRAARAVGGACGANPIPVLVPCHRVLGAGGRVGGFSGGLVWKRKLLAREGVAVK